MNDVIVKGKTIEAAIEAACIQLDTSRNRVRVTVMEHPKKGFLGLFGSRRAMVKVERIDLKGELHVFLQQLIEKMGMDATVHVEKSSRRELLYRLEGNDLALLIGKNGHTLESIQYLVQNIFYADLRKQKMNVLIDAGDYRSRKKKMLRGIAERSAEWVLRTKKKMVLDPMPANERKIIHHTLEKRPHLKTKSVGSDPQRSVAIYWNP